MADFSQKLMDWLKKNDLFVLLDNLISRILKLERIPPGSATFGALGGAARDNADLLTEFQTTDAHAAASAPHSGHVQVGGQIGGTAASPDVRGLRETSGPTLITMGAWADGEYLKLDGTTAKGGTPAGGGGGVVEDTEANRPPAGTQGRIFKPSNGYYEQVDTGAAWNTYVKNIKCTAPPAASGLTGVYAAAGDSLADTIEGLEIKRLGTGSAQNYQACYVKAVPAAPYALTVGVFIQHIRQAAYAGVGICLADGNSGTPKMAGFYFMFRGAAYSDLHIQNTYWTNSTTVSTENNVVLSGWSGVSYPLLWMRIRDDNTNRYYELSSDRFNWQIAATKTRTDFLTPTHGGVFLASTITAGAGVEVAKMRVFDWSLA